MNQVKIVLSVVAVILTFIGYVPYISNTLKGKTTPHIYSWFIWGLVTLIAYGLQVDAGAGVGAWTTLAIALICFFIFILGLKDVKNDITKLDTIFFILSVGAIFLWLIVKQPILSIILISSIDMLAFIPTIRKSWDKPYSETLFLYALSAFRHGLSLLALQQYNIVTWLFPLTWIFANTFFSVLLIVKRKQIKK